MNKKQLYCEIVEHWEQIKRSYNLMFEVAEVNGNYLDTCRLVTGEARLIIKDIATMKSKWKILKKSDLEMYLNEAVNIINKYEKFIDNQLSMM